MDNFVQFLIENIALIGGAGFIGILFMVGSKAERVMVLVVGASIAAYLITGSFNMLFGALVVGGSLIWLDWLRTAR